MFQTVWGILYLWPMWHDVTVLTRCYAWCYRGCSRSGEARLPLLWETQSRLEIPCRNSIPAWQLLTRPRELPLAQASSGSGAEYTNAVIYRNAPQFSQLTFFVTDIFMSVPLKLAFCYASPFGSGNTLSKRRTSGAFLFAWNCGTTFQYLGQRYR